VKARFLVLLMAAAFFVAMFAAVRCEANTWATVAQLHIPTEQSIKDPRVFGAASGGFHVAYKTTVDGWKIKYRRWQNGSFTLAPVLVHQLGYLGGIMDLAEAMNGDIWITWENWAPDNEQVYAGRSSDMLNWTLYDITQYVYPPGEGGQGKNPNITPYGATGSPVMIATNVRAKYNELMYAKWDGSSWSPITGMGTYTDNYYASYGSCRNPVDGSVYRTYGRIVNGSWQICMRRFNGVSWEPEIVVSTNTGSSFVARPSIAISQGGHILVVWDQDTTIQARHYDPVVGWQPQTQADEGYNPVVIAVPNRNEFYVAYLSNNRVLGKRYRSREWQNGADTVCAGMTVGPYLANLDLGAAPDGTLFACWEYFADGGPYGLYTTSANFTITDPTPPPAPSIVMDDGDTTDSTTDLHFTWAPVTDPESGVERYEYCIGTSPGAYDTRYWVYAGTGNSFTAHGLNLSPGTTYYISVRAVNNAGQIGAATSSDGILCDPSVNTIVFGVTSNVSSAGSACDQPGLAKCSTGGMHLVYREASGSSYKIAYRKLTGEVWSSAEYPGNVNPSGYFPDVAEDINGNARVIFANPGGREGNDYYESVRTTGWSTPINFTTIGTLDWYPRIVTGSGSELIHLICIGDNTTYNVKHRSRSAGGWNAFTNIGSGSYVGSRYGIPDVAADSSGNLLAIWASPTDVRFAKRTGGVWSSASTVASHPGAFLCYPRIAVDAGGLAHVVYADHNITPEPGVYYLRQTSGSTWSTPQLIANGTSPAIAVDNDGRVHVVYQKTNGTKTDIYHKFLGGSTWSQEQNLSNNSGASQNATLRLDSDGVLHVAWADDTSGTFQIYWRHTIPEPLTCGYVKTLPDGAVVELKNKVVTAIFSSDSCIYIEEPNRTSGIRVQSSGSGLALGNYVNVTGSMGVLTVNGVRYERKIDATSVTKVSNGFQIEPLAMNCKAVGGGSVPPYFVGVLDGVGVNNIGSLVRIAGKVTYTVSNYFYVDDGSNIPDISGRKGVMVKYPSTPLPVAVGDKVIVTGIVQGSVPSGWQYNRRYIVVRNANDVRKL